MDFILSSFQALDACFLGVFTRLMTVTFAKGLFTVWLASNSAVGQTEIQTPVLFGPSVPVPSLSVADDGTSSLFSSPSPLFFIG